MLKLHRRQLIALPERRRTPARRGPLLSPELFDAVVPEPIVTNLSWLLPLQVQVVGPKHPDYHQFQRYLAQHHYLSYRGPVGENLGYLIRSCAGVDLACLLFGAAAWQCAPRDRWIGWSPQQRAAGLAGIANNSRFLILPWVKVRHLASHLLSQIAGRIHIHPLQECECGEDLSQEPALDFERRQVLDLPPLTLECTEHRAEIKDCPCCHTRVRAAFPEAVNAPVQYGKNFRSLAGLRPIAPA